MKVLLSSSLRNFKTLKNIVNGEYSCLDNWEGNLEKSVNQNSYMQKTDRFLVQILLSKNKKLIEYE